MKNRNEPFEEAYRRSAFQQQDKDDKSVYKVVHNGEELTIVERNHEFKIIPDPEDDSGFVPMTVSETKYRLGDDGIPIRSNQAGFCRFKCYCNIKALAVCSHCGQVVCRKHRITVRNKVYCKKGFCLFIGRSYKAYWGLFRVIRFCLRSVLGIDSTKDETEQRHDEELFDNPKEDITSDERF